MDTDQLVTATEAAAMKGMALNHLKYYLAKSGAPQPYYIGVHRHRYYMAPEIEAWQPKRDR